MCDRYGIAELRVFGSRSRGTARPDSDIDILYTLQPGRTLGWDIEQLADELAALLGHPVDLISARALHPRLQPAVLAEARPLYTCQGPTEPNFVLQPEDTPWFDHFRREAETLWINGSPHDLSAR